MTSASLRVVVMGASGSGKTTVGAQLAERLGLPFGDADDFHPPSSVAKMRAGTPLTDADRAPWLEAIGSWLASHESDGAVVTCSALTRAHRNQLRRHAPDLQLLFLTGDPELLARRMRGRRSHFMPPSLLQSQLDVLEPPAADEATVIVDAAEFPSAIVAEFVEALEDLAFQRLYGPWAAWIPDEAKAVFDSTGLVWWIAGGYAVQAFTGTLRSHEDIDVSIFRRDAPRLVEALDGRFHAWAAGGPGLVPLTDAASALPERADQIWLREHALSPWRADVVLNADRRGDWVSRRDPIFAAPLDRVTWCQDDIRYLNPEIALAFKAKLARPKDQRDFEVAEPLLDAKARRWLTDFLRRKEPDHPWLAQM